MTSVHNPEQMFSGRVTPREEVKKDSKGRKEKNKKENSKCEPSYKVISVHIPEQTFSGRE